MRSRVGAPSLAQHPGGPGISGAARDGAAGWNAVNVTTYGVASEVGAPKFRPEKKLGIRTIAEAGVQYLASWPGY